MHVSVHILMIIFKVFLKQFLQISWIINKYNYVFGESHHILQPELVLYCHKNIII